MQQEVFVEGMKCQGCANTVIEKFESVKGVESASVDLPSKKVTLDTRSVIDPAVLDSALVNTKYSVLE